MAGLVNGEGELSRSKQAGGAGLLIREVPIEAGNRGVRGTTPDAKIAKEAG
jgi:hypothetical protein